MFNTILSWFKQNKPISEQEKNSTLEYIKLHEYDAEYYSKLSSTTHAKEFWKIYDGYISEYGMDCDLMDGLIYKYNFGVFTEDGKVIYVGDKLTEYLL